MSLNLTAPGTISGESFPLPENVDHEKRSSPAVSAVTEPAKPPVDDDVFIAFARVYSGKLRVGQNLFVLGPKHNPTTALSKVRSLKLPELLSSKLSRFNDCSNVSFAGEKG